MYSNVKKIVYYLHFQELYKVMYMSISMLYENSNNILNESNMQYALPIYRYFFFLCINYNHFKDNIWIC